MPRAACGEEALWELSLRPLQTEGEAPFASAAVEAFAAEEEEEGSALAQKQGKRAPRAVAAVLESRAARGDSEEGPLEAREDDGAIPQVPERAVGGNGRREETGSRRESGGCPPETWVLRRFRRAGKGRHLTRTWTAPGVSWGPAKGR